LPTITVRPESFEDLLEILVAFKNHVEAVKSEGWEPFQDDEKYIYETKDDWKVCPVCAGEPNNFNGTYIPNEFPGFKWTVPLHEAEPYTHNTHPEIYGTCRCKVHWIDAVVTLTNRLAGELEEML